MIEVITGPMFSGKTSTLLSKVMDVQENGLSYVVLKPNIRSRYKVINNAITSHDGLYSVNAEIAYGLDDVAYIGQGKSYVFIDEVQFFNDSLYKVATWLKHVKCNVICSGLNLDYHKEPFPTMANLLTVADNIIKIKATCYQCGEPAEYSKRIIDSDELYLVGGEDSYKPCCYEHYE